MPTRKHPIDAEFLVAEETFCCGHKRCPTARVYSDGSVVVTDDDGAPQRIDFNPDQARALLALLKEKLTCS